jgi:DNA-directed RNA polymerase specialized sigma24 family protein
MSHEPPEMDFFANLYRFAWILLLREDMARKVVMDALGEMHLRPAHSHDEAERIQARLYQVVRQRALRVTVDSFTPVVPGSAGWPDAAGPHLSGMDPNAVATALHRAEEPGRSALALVLLDAVEVESMEKILGLSVAQLAVATDRARAAVAQVLKLTPEVQR